MSAVSATCAKLVRPRYTGISTFFRAETADSLEGVDIGVIGVPYDGGASNRPGARYGPKDVRDASSNHIRAVNQTTGVAPFDMGLAIRDLGDAVVEKPFQLEGAHEEIEAMYKNVVEANVWPLTCGGDHSISLPILRALRAAHDEPLSLIHIDAHADTGDDYLGSRFHHGAPFKIATDEGLIDPKRTIQIGIRGTIAEHAMWQFSYDSGMRVMGMEEFVALVREDPTLVTDEIKKIVGDTKTYITFDIDVLDPAFAPGTGTPEIGGMSSYEAQELMRGIYALDLDIVGADMVEVSPPWDPGYVTSLNGANILFELLCIATQARARSE
jgi:guanidinopropionase